MPKKASREERRVLHAVRLARMAVPGYARGRPITSADLGRLAAFNNLRIHTSRDSLSVPAMLLPPIGGEHRLLMAPFLSHQVRRYVALHEIGHILTGDADEPTILKFTGPLPEAEDVVDAFALMGILDETDIDAGPGWVEDRIRELVPLDDRGWRVHRIPRLAPKVVRLHGLMENEA